MNGTISFFKLFYSVRKERWTTTNNILINMWQVIVFIWFKMVQYMFNQVYAGDFETDKVYL